MASSLPNLLKNLCGGIHRNVNLDTMIKKCEICGIKCKNCNFFLEYTNFKEDLIECKCLSCNNKSYQQKFVEKL